jgi:hypothetical protein
MKWIAIAIISLYTVFTKFLRRATIAVAIWISEPVLQFMPFRKINQSPLSDTFNQKDMIYLSAAKLVDADGPTVDITGLIMLLYCTGQLNGEQFAEIIKNKYGASTYTVMLDMRCAILSDDGYYIMRARQSETQFTDGVCGNDFGIFPVF